MGPRGTVAVALGLIVAAQGATATRHAEGVRPPRHEPVRFAPAERFNVGSSAASVAIGDLNSDGLNDVVVSTTVFDQPQNDFKLFVFLQQPDGTLEMTDRLDTDGLSNDDMGVAVGDIDGDGDGDVALATHPGVDVFFQNQGEFQSRIHYRTRDPAQHVELGDINSDGQVDIAVDTLDGIKLLVNKGSDFRLSRVAFEPQNEIELGDVSGDGLLDIVACEGGPGCTGVGTSELHVWRQVPDGRFRESVYPASDTTGSGLAVGDLTGDGRADVVMTISHNLPDAAVDVFVQRDDGRLGAPVILGTYELPGTTEIADIDADGLADLVVVHGGWHAVGIYYQLPEGRLSGEQLHATWAGNDPGVKGLAVGDVSGDGLTDIAYVDHTAGLFVLRQLP